MAIPVHDRIIDTDKQYKGLVAHSEVSRLLQVNSEAIKPCVAAIINTPFDKGDTPNRTDASVAIICELIRLDLPRERVECILAEWNKRNLAPRRDKEIAQAIKSAYRKNDMGTGYKFSCFHATLEAFCIGEEFCSVTKDKDKLIRHDYRRYFTYNWQLILSNAPNLIYWLAIPELERRRGLKPGEKIFSSQADIAKFAGISRRSVGKALDELAKHGLIKYKAGTPRKWERLASEIARIFPIPKPDKKILAGLEIDERFNEKGVA